MNRDLSSNWKVKKIGDVCKVARGSSPRPIADPKYFEGGNVPWIKIADATKSGKHLYETKEKLNEYGASFSKLLPKGSLIVAASGVTLGYTQLLGIDGCVHDGWLYLTDLQGVDKDFLYYTLIWRNQHFHNSSYGAAIQNINTMILREMEIALPSLSTQEKIGSILSAYDDLIENNTRRIKILEEMAQLLYREWFVNFRFPGHEQVKMVESAIGLIPEGWEVRRLEQIASVNKANIKTNNTPKVIKYIDIASVTTGLINKIETLDFVDSPSRARRLVQHGDIIWSTVRPNRRSYSLILNPSKNLVVSTGFAVITAERIPYTFLYHALTTDSFVDYLTNNATGSAYPAVNSNDFKNADILTPTDELLNKFNSAVEDMLAHRHNLKLKNENLQKTRDLLLPKLISGEIDVESLDRAIRADTEELAA